MPVVYQKHHPDSESACILHGHVSHTLMVQYVCAREMKVVYQRHQDPEPAHIMLSYVYGAIRVCARDMPVIYQKHHPDSQSACILHGHVT
jgi:hypothetical protein